VGRKSSALALPANNGSSDQEQPEEISLLYAGSPPPVIASPPDTPESSSASGPETSAEELRRRRQRVQLADSLAASYPSASLSRALRDVPGAEAIEAGEANKLEPTISLASAEAVQQQQPVLSRSCYASLRGSPSGDSELADFDWLVSLKPSPAGLLCCDPIDAEPPPLQQQQQQQSAEDSASTVAAAAAAASNDAPSPLCATLRALSGDYDPQADRLMKPPYSFSCLIFMALEASPDKCLPVKKIYQWIEDNFPYYRHANNGWKNSVRHNLSLNKSFTKVFRDVSIKGSLWTVDPMARAGMLQALKKTPYHPFAQVQMYCTAGTLYKTGASGGRERQQQQQQQQLQQAAGSVASATSAVPATTLGRLRYSGLLGTALLAAAAAAANPGATPSGADASSPAAADAGACGSGHQEASAAAAAAPDDAPSATTSAAATPTPTLHQYHPHVNSFRGVQTPRVKLELFDPASSAAGGTAGVAKEASDEDACNGGVERQQAGRTPRKQDLVPSAHLYPFLAAKMRRLVHLLGDQASDPDCLQHADANTDDDDDEEEDGYVEVEQPVKRPRGRPRKDSAPVYRPLPLAKSANRRKKNRRLGGGKSSGMPSVNELVAAAQMTQMKREAAATAAVAAASAGKPKPPKLEPAPAPTSLPVSPSRLQDAQALCLVFKRAADEAAATTAATAAADSAADAEQCRPTEAKMPKLIAASRAAADLQESAAASADGDESEASSSALVRLALNPSALRVPCGPVSPTNSEPGSAEQQQQQQPVPAVGQQESKTRTIGGARVRVLQSTKSTVANTASQFQPMISLPKLHQQQPLLQPQPQLLLQPFLAAASMPAVVGAPAAPASTVGGSLSHFIIKLAGNR
ncbi:hypothetical protein BOX15_Mlig017570g2, partial [Macrostomum lignano]